MVHQLHGLDQATQRWEAPSRMWLHHELRNCWLNPAVSELDHEVWWFQLKRLRDVTTMLCVDGLEQHLYNLGTFYVHFL